MKATLEGRGLFALCATSVIASTLLVNTNKIILEGKIVSGPAAGLTFLHYCTTAVVLRLHCCGNSGRNVSDVPASRLIAISMASTLGVACSNLVLKLSSVSFQLNAIGRSPIRMT